MDKWQEVAESYLREIKQLWEDIESVAFELEKKEPRSLIKATNMLDQCLDFSIKNVKLLSYIEPYQYSTVNSCKAANHSIKVEKLKEPEKTENIERKVKNEDCFKWLRS